MEFYVVDMKIYFLIEDGFKVLFVVFEDEWWVWNWDGFYMDGDFLLLDLWGGDFDYEYNGEFGKGKFWICLFGFDGEVDIDDDIVN